MSRSAMSGSGDEAGGGDEVRWLLWLFAVVVLFVLVTVSGVSVLIASAGAAQFGRYGSLAGEFVEPHGIAVDQATGDVIVVDTNNSRVERFSSDGAFQLAWGWGVADGTTRALQTCRVRCFAGARGAGAGELGFAEGVAVDNNPGSSSRGDVYVVDLGNRRVEKFTATGRFLLMFGGEVNETAHAHGAHASEDLCPVNPGDKCKDGTPGPANGQFEFPVEGSFIAIGPDGMVYIGDRNRIQQFTPAGIYHSQTKLSPNPTGPGNNELGGVSGLAVNSQGDLYAIRNDITGVNEYEPSGDLLQTLDEQAEPAGPEGPTPAVAVGSNGQVFIDDIANGEHRIDEYNSEGAKLATFDKGFEDGLNGIAYDNRTHQLYVINTIDNTAPPTMEVRIVTPPDPRPVPPAHKLTEAVLFSV
jgi:tripartite motif-containing protein 71